MTERDTTGVAISEAVSPERLGARVRALRRRRGLTLEALSRGSGVSRAMISKVERGEKNPTLVIAAKLAEGLGVTLSQLAGVEYRREVIVVPRERRQVVRDPETGFERQLLSPALAGRGVELVRNVIPERGTSGEFPPYRRGTEGHVVVESGCLRAVLGGDEYLLEHGDAVYFEADVPHRFDNAGRGECSYYLIVSSGVARME